jgi:hypothetical protein
MRTILRNVFAVALLSSLVSALGCKGVEPGHESGEAGPPRAVVEVKADEDLAAEKTVAVDIIGAREVERYFWNAKSVDAYWRPGDRDRARADRYEMRGFDERNLQTLEKDDPIWEKWEENGVRYLFVIGYVPGVRGDADRKLDFDLKEVRGKTIPILVTAERLEPVK